MVARRADGAEGRVRLTVAQGPYGHEARPGSQARRSPRAGAHRRIGVDPTTTRLVELDQGGEVRGRMAPQQVLFGRSHRRPPDHRIAEAGRVEA